MSQTKVRQSINFIKDFLKDRGIGVEKIVLFGSYSRNQASHDSDIDIAIVSRDFRGKDIFERANMLRGLSWSLVERFLLPFDIVPISLDEWNNSSSMIVGFIKEGH